MWYRALSCDVLKLLIHQPSENQVRLTPSGPSIEVHELGLIAYAIGSTYRSAHDRTFIPTRSKQIYANQICNWQQFVPAYDSAGGKHQRSDSRSSVCAGNLKLGKAQLYFERRVCKVSVIRMFMVYLYKNITTRRKMDESK
jgi:hypothetical protein